jgi:hypothetical protein
MKSYKNPNTALFFTKHAQARMQQRSFSKSDISSIIHLGTFINDKEVLFTRKDTEREISNLREHIKTIIHRISKNRIDLCGTEIRQSNDSLYSKLSYLRQQIDGLERLKNRKVVVSGNHVVTCYSCSKSELKRISKVIN